MYVTYFCANRDLIIAQYELDLKVVFPGIGNDLKTTICLPPISSGLHRSQLSDDNQSLDLPPYVVVSSILPADLDVRFLLSELIGKSLMKWIIQRPILQPMESNKRLVFQCCTNCTY